MRHLRLLNVLIDSFGFRSDCGSVTTRAEKPVLRRREVNRCQRNCAIVLIQMVYWTFRSSALAAS